MTRVCLIMISLIGAGGALADDWAAYVSRNFTVYSDLPEGEVLRTIGEFEVFRQVTLMMLNLPDQPENERLKILVFERTRDFNRINGNFRNIGFFYHSVFGPRMIVGPQESDETRQTLFHEYVHYLMNNRFAVNYPRWYFEGIAGLLENLEIERSSIRIGRPPTFGVWSPAPVADVVGMKHEIIFSDFYQTAWLMVHHFLIDSYEDPTRARQTADYIRRFDAGEDPVEAFVESYGIPPEDMHDELNFYRDRYRFTTIEFPPMEYTGEVSRRLLAPGEDLYILGDIAIELGQYGPAYEYFDEFEELDEPGGGSSFAVNVMSRRAIGYIHEERVDEGDALIGALLAMDTLNADALADIAHYAYDRYVYDQDYADEPDREYLERSIEFGERAIAENPGDLEALYYLGLSYELDGDLQRAADTLLDSYDVNPSVPPLNLSLARVLLKGRQVELASYLISRVYSASHSQETRDRLRLLKSIIESEAFDIDDISEYL